MTDHSESIMQGVYNWLDAHKDEVLTLVGTSVNAAISSSTEKAIDNLAGGVMLSVSEFLNQNSQDLKSTIAAAIAVNWAAKQHPTPGTAPAHPYRKD
jgi:hypothetical protein